MGIRADSGCRKSGRADLNRRPHGPEPCALAGLSHAPIFKTKVVGIITEAGGFDQGWFGRSSLELYRQPRYNGFVTIGCVIVVFLARGCATG